MRNVILMTLLAVMSSSAVAEWVKVGSNERFTSYVDPATISKEGDKVQMWHLYDYNTAHGDSSDTKYLSMKMLDENDCKAENSRTIALSFHSENMGRGKVIYSNSDSGKWEKVPADSGIQIFWKTACGKN